MEERRENIMGTQPINRLLPSMAFPIMLSMLVQALYNVVDSVFVSMVSENALTSVSLAFPVQNLMIAVSVGTAVGINALLSRRLGEKNFEAANKVAENGIFVTVLSWAVFAVFGAACSGLFMGAFTQNAEILAGGTDYMWIVTVFSLGLFMSVTMERVLQVTGKTVYQMISQMTGAVVNIILDPVFIFGWLGLPAMGIAGAAIASSASEMISMVFFIVYTRLRIDHRKYGLFRFAGFSSKLLRGMLNVSVWTMIQMFVAISTWFFFFIAVEHLGERPLAVTNIIRSVSGIVFVIVSSFASTASTLVSNQMGAGQPELVAGTTRRIVGMCYLIVIPLLALFAVFPELILRIYTDEQSLIDGSVASLRVMLSSYLISVPAFIRFNVVSGTGNTRSALMLELATLSVYAIYTVWIVLYRHSDVALCWTTEHVYALVLLLLASLYLKKARWQDRKI